MTATTDTSPTKEATQAEHLAQRIKAHKEEVARLREEIGDPQAALFRFMTEHFTAEAIFPETNLPPEHRRPVWNVDDDEWDAR